MGNAVHGAEIMAVQRSRMLVAAASVVQRHGLGGLSVANVAAASGVSRRTFYEVFADRDVCLRTLVQWALERAAARVLPAYDRHEPWRDAMRAGLAAALAFVDEEPALGWLLVVEVLGTNGGVVAERRDEILALAIDAVDRGRQLGRCPEGMSRLTAEGVVGGVLAIVRAQLQHADGERGRDRTVAGLLGQLMGIVTLPYLGPAAATRERQRPLPSAAPAQSASQTSAEALRDLPIRLTYRTVMVLGAIAACPGGCNREVARRAGVSDQGQISKLLRRLAKVGLVENALASDPRGQANAWRLTERGADLQRALHVSDGDVLAQRARATSALASTSSMSQ